MKPYLTVLLIFSYCLILFYGCDNSKQDSETISKEIIQKATSIKTGSGLDYFKSQPNHELIHINGHSLNVIVSYDGISVQMRM
ncbi:MAG: hypothetical protein R6U11_11710 [Bacteroidales bacterium]